MAKPVRYAHVRNPEPSLSFYAEVKDLVKRIDPERGVVANPRLSATPHGTGQPRLFALDVLGEGGRLKALRLEARAARARRHPEAPQQALFRYVEAP